MTDGEQHDRLRRWIQPAFSRRRIEQYPGSMLRSAARVSAGWTDGATVAIDGASKRMTIMTAAEALFGITRPEDQLHLIDGFR